MTAVEDTLRDCDKKLEKGESNAVFSATKLDKLIVGESTAVFSATKLDSKDSVSEIKLSLAIAKTVYIIATFWAIFATFLAKYLLYYFL